MEQVIKVENVTKKFRVYYDKGSSLKEKLLFRNRNKYEERIVLNNISFSVNKGEALGLIGKNGCGKSTTLKLLNKIMYPDSGSITTKGRISSLIELGAGFHPDMSGRENIYTNASIFGLTKKEITDRMGAIIKFSEMEEFLDNPVRTYSSGMYMRLAFSIAINVDAEILLIDEILGVGDISFQAKCFEKLRQIKAAGTTIVIVSHSLGQLEQICDRSIWFENGLIKDEGIPKFVHERYLYGMEKERMDKIEEEFQEEIKHSKEIPANNIPKSMTEENILEQKPEESGTVDKAENTIENLRNKGNLVNIGTERALRRGTQTAFFTNIQLVNEKGEPQKIYKTGDTLILKLNYKCTQHNLPVNIGYAIYRDDGLYCYGTNCIFELGTPIILKEQGKLSIRMDNIQFLPNKYMMDIAIQSPNGIEYDNICFATEFQIKMNKRDTGVCRIDNTWDVEALEYYEG